MSTQSSQVAERRRTIIDLAQSHGWKVAELRVPPTVAGYASAPHLVAWRDGVRLLDGPWLHVDTSPESVVGALSVFDGSHTPTDEPNDGESGPAGPLPGGSDQ